MNGMPPSLETGDGACPFLGSNGPEEEEAASGEGVGVEIGELMAQPWEGKSPPAVGGGATSVGAKPGEGSGVMTLTGSFSPSSQLLLELSRVEK